MNTLIYLPECIRHSKNKKKNLSRKENLRVA